MKTMTTLTAVAALIAGMSIAVAQMSPSSGSPSASGSSGMFAQQATASGKYCLEASSGGALSCRAASGEPEGTAMQPGGHARRSPSGATGSGNSSDIEVSKGGGSVQSQVVNRFGMTEKDAQRGQRVCSAGRVRTSAPPALRNFT